jgi:hypothetical protein
MENSASKNMGKIVSKIYGKKLWADVHGARAEI